MRLKFSGLRRPALLALLLGGAMVYLAINGFDVSATAIGQAALLSVVLVLGIAIPAGLLVLLIKWIKYLRR